MKKAIEIGKFSSFSIAHGVETSILQHVDDTIFVGKACTQNLWTVKAIFEVLRVSIIA